MRSSDFPVTQIFQYPPAHSMGLADAPTTDGNLRDDIISVQPDAPKRRLSSLHQSPIRSSEYPGKFVNHWLRKRESRKISRSCAFGNFFMSYLLSLPNEKLSWIRNTLLKWMCIFWNVLRNRFVKFVLIIPNYIRKWM